MIIELIIVSFLTLLSAPLALMLARRGWSRLRAILLAPIPLPGVISVLCIWVFVDAAMSSPAECGVDACGMAMMFAAFGLIGAVAAYVVGVVGSALVLWLLPLRTPVDETTFR